MNIIEGLLIHKKYSHRVIDEIYPEDGGKFYGSEQECQQFINEGDEWCCVVVPVRQIDRKDLNLWLGHNSSFTH